MWWEARLSLQRLSITSWTSPASLGSTGAHCWDGFLENKSDLASLSYFVAGGKFSLVPLLLSIVTGGRPLSFSNGQESNCQLYQHHPWSSRDQGVGKQQLGFMGAKREEEIFQQDLNDPTEQRVRPSGNKLLGCSSNISKINSHNLTLPSSLHYLS